VTTQAIKETAQPPKVATQAPKVVTQAPKETNQAQKVTTQAPKETTQPPKVATQAPKVVTQAPKETTQAPKVTTQAPKETTQPPKVVTQAPKATQKTGKTLKPTKPAEIDCDKNHQVSVQDDKNINGVLTVKSCKSSRFVNNPGRCSSVSTKFSSLLNGRLAKLGLNDQFNLNIVKTAGNATCTEFRYTLPCDKSHQTTVITSLKDACKDKDLADTVTEEKQQEEGESSSESSEEATIKPALPKVTQKESIETKPTAAPAKSTAAPIKPTAAPVKPTGKFFTAFETTKKQ
jgi:hypothetical protein